MPPSPLPVIVTQGVPNPATAGESCHPHTLDTSDPQQPVAGIKSLVVTELHKQWPLVLPLVGMNMTWTGKMVLTTVFLGHLGELPLAGGALGLMFGNVTGFAVLTGLCAAMEPICGQAFGAQNFRLMHRTLLMTILLLLFASVPISVVWLNIDRILVHFGQQPDIAAMAKTYIYWLLPHLLVTAFLGPLKVYLSTQGVTAPILVSSLIALALHVPINILLSRALGVPGVAMGVWITDLNLTIMLFCYTLLRECRRRSISKGVGDTEMEDSEESGGCCLSQKLRDWFRFLRLSGPCCLTTCLEWWCYEINILLSGRLPNAERAVSVLTVILNMDYLVYVVMLSLATSASIRVSNELGAGRAMAALNSARVSFGFSVVCGVIAGLAIVGCRGFWGSLFSHNPGIVSGVKKLLLVMAAIETVNFPLILCGGLARGTARPQLGMYAIIGGFYLVALPLGALLAFKVRIGVTGLLLGLLVGAVTSFIVLLLLVGRIDWVLEARKANMLSTEGKAGDSAAPAQEDSRVSETRI